MDWVVAVSASETAGGALTPETEAAARAALQEHGCVLLRGAFPSATIEAMHGEYVAQLGTLDLAAMETESKKPPPNRLIGVGRARYDTTLRMTGAFSRMDVFASGLLLNFLRPLLGRDMRLNSFTAVASYPGAPQQAPHRDHDHLFSQPGVAANLPVYAVNVAVPLIDVDLETGPTGVWLGSHRSGQVVAVQGKDMAASPLQRGDCMLLDYRTLHAGLPNRSGKARPIVYMVYGRRWFFDDVNYINRIPLDMPLERYHELPETVRPLLVRAFSYAMLTHWHEADVQAKPMIR
jgi:Phytanoyl-CoA dioxygenase (PhyH)